MKAKTYKVVVRRWGTIFPKTEYIKADEMAWHEDVMLLVRRGENCGTYHIGTVAYHGDIVFACHKGNLYQACEVRKAKVDNQPELPIAQ